METELRIVQYAELGTLYLPYYRFFQKMYGKTVFARYIETLLEKGEKVPVIIGKLDDCYDKAVNAVNSVHHSFDNVMLGIYDLEGHLLAVGRIKLGLPSNKSNAIVGETIIIDENMTDAQKTELYASFIKGVEEAVSGLKDIELLTFEVPKYDDAFETSVKELGYDLDEEDTRWQVTSLYDKNLRERALVRSLENVAPRE